MRRSSFKQPTYQEAMAKKRAADARKRKKALTTKKAPKKRAKAKNKPKRTKLPSIKTMRNKCDKLLTPIIKELSPRCVLTGEPTEVAHHHIKKSKSTALRYYLPNLVPLTHKAHMRLHNDETYWSSKLVEIYGIEWFQDLEEKKNQLVKADVHFYIENYERLRKIYDDLQANA